MSTAARRDIEIVRYAHVADAQAARAAMIEIVHEAGGARVFSTTEERAVFEEKWLGRYLDNPGLDALVARSGDAVVGYLVGARMDPLGAPFFGDHGYLTAFAACLPAYPAHLHINVAAAHRGGGNGARLIAAYVGDLVGSGCRGVHVVTRAGVRNVAFYRRCGFAPRAVAVVEGRALLFLGRSLLP